MGREREQQVLAKDMTVAQTAVLIVIYRAAAAVVDQRHQISLVLTLKTDKREVLEPQIHFLVLLSLMPRAVAAAVALEHRQQELAALEDQLA
jgi:hypothetical protein